MINRLCMCKGHTGHTKVLDSKLSWLTIDLGDIVLPLIDKWERAILIRQKMYKPNLTKWCHMSHRRSSQCTMWTCMYDHHHVTFIHTSNCITLRSDLLHMVNILKSHMVGHGKWGEGTGLGRVRKLGCINDKSVYGSICSKLPAECTGMWKRYLINHPENMCSSGSVIGRPPSFWTQLSIHTNDTLALNDDFMIMCITSLTKKQQLEHI